MRFMALMVEKPREDGWTPSAGEMAAMIQFNREMDKAGVRLSAEGLQPPSKGARVSFGDGAPKITDGPFAESKEVIGGFWMIQAKSKAEAVEWFRRCPAAPGAVIEIRPVFEMADFPEDIRKAAGL